jgi:hypothetical protein
MNFLLLFLLSINLFTSLKMMTEQKSTPKKWPRLNYRVGEEDKPSLMLLQHSLYPLQNTTADTQTIATAMNTFIDNVKTAHPNKTLHVVINLADANSHNQNIVFNRKEFYKNLVTEFPGNNDVDCTFIDSHTDLQDNLPDDSPENTLYTENLYTDKTALKTYQGKSRVWITQCSHDNNWCNVNDAQNDPHGSDYKQKCVTYEDIETKIKKQSVTNKEIHTVFFFPFPGNNQYDSQTGYSDTVRNLLEKYWPKQAAAEIYTDLCTGNTDTKKNYWQMIIQKICDNGTLIGAGFGIVLVGGIAAYLFLRHKA